MNYLKNQNGSTLVVAIIILVVFTVLGFGLITLNASATKQFDSKEHQVKARHFAEMGVVHYQSEIELKLNALNNTINMINSRDDLNIEEKTREINKLTTTEYLCNLTTNNLINDINASSYSNNKYKLQFVSCDDGESNGLIDILVIGKGISNNKEKDIHFDFTIKAPGIIPPPNPEPEIDKDPDKGNVTEDKDNPPTIPEAPSSGINYEWPCDKKGCEPLVKSFTDVSKEDTVTTKKGSIIFEDSLITNNFRVDGGNGFNLLVEKDLYIKGKLDVQNHACIMVQGNFTATTEILSKNKFYLFVYGDANLPAGFTINQLTSANNGIFITGDVYIGGKKVDKDTIQLVKKVPTKHDTCSLPEVTSPETTETPEFSENPNKENHNISNATIIINEYLY